MTRHRLTDLLFYTLGLLALLSFSAAVLVVLHGFAGGYGHHDLAVVLLGLPASAVLPLIPDILLVRHTSLFNVVALPWMLNSIVTLTLYIAARPFATAERTAPHNPTL